MLLVDGLCLFLFSLVFVQPGEMDGFWEVFVVFVVPSFAAKFVWSMDAIQRS